MRKKTDFTQQQEHNDVSKKETEAEQIAKGVSQVPERKGPRKNASKTSSLRRVAVEAQNQRSRGFVKGRGNKRFVDPDVDTKVEPSYFSRNMKK